MKLLNRSSANVLQSVAGDGGDIVKRIVLVVHCVIDICDLEVAFVGKTD
jgi:hypothetical protein